MANSDEIVNSPVTRPIPHPDRAPALAPPHPTPETVLHWIAQAGEKPWYPSQHAAANQSDRDTLDEPLNQLRVDGLIRIAAWERGLGQGYVLTPQGELALAGGSVSIGQAIPTAGESDATAAIASSDDPTTEALGLNPRPGLVVPILLAANLLWFFVGLVMVLRTGQSTWQYLSEGNAVVLHELGAVNGQDLLKGEWWRLATACFVHIGGIHLLFNLFALVMVGPLAESLWGRKRLLVIYVLSGLAGNCLAMALKPESLLAGASGAIWGLLLSLVTWIVSFRAYLTADEVADSARRLTVVIILNGMYSLMPGISWQAHLGGGLAGLVTAGLLNALRFGHRTRRTVAFGLLVSLTIGCVASLLASMRWSEVWVGFRHRVAEEEKRAAMKAAADRFDQEVVPLLRKLKPSMVILPPKGIRFDLSPAETMAANQLSRPGARRNAARVAEAQAKLKELKSIADAVVQDLQDSPVGDESLDLRRERARKFAEARAKSFASLLKMLDSPSLPDEAEWSKWVSVCRTADALWLEFTRR